MTVVEAGGSVSSEVGRLAVPGPYGRVSQVLSCQDGMLVLANDPHTQWSRESVTVLPQPGDLVRVATTGGGATQGRWLQLLDTRDAVPGPLRAQLLCDGRLEEITVPDCGWDYRQVVTDPGGPHDRAWADALLGLLAEHTRWKETLTRDVHELAYTHDLCADFDDFMQDHGLAPRTSDYELCVQVSATVYLTVSAVSTTTALDTLDREDIMSALTEDPHQLTWTADLEC